MFNTIYSVLFNEFYPFEKLGRNHVVLKSGDSIKDGNSFLILHGGGDISPSIYGETPHPTTDNKNKVLTGRDKIEIEFAKQAIEKQIPIMAICRGAQLMCCLNGGKLIQNVTHHHTPHTINLYNGTKIFTNSIHHQMMYPWFTNHELLAWTKGQSSKFEGSRPHDDVLFPEHAYELDEDHDPIEPEIVWFPETKTLAIQGHPEWAQEYPLFQEFVIKEFMDRTK